jgi:hypothetical protein
MNETMNSSSSSWSSQKLVLLLVIIIVMIHPSGAVLVTMKAEVEITRIVVFSRKEHH